MIRTCPVCHSEMAPKFASECEAPVAWSCLECGLLQLEMGGRPFTAEEEAAVRALGVPTAQEGPRRGVRTTRAAAQAREILDGLEVGLPVDVEAVAERLGYPVRWRGLSKEYRGGVEGEVGHRVLVLNREYPFRSEGERRWAVAEELGHAIFEHGTLVASEAASHMPILLEPPRQVQEAEAKAFAAELLMPAAAVRRAFAREQSLILRALGSDERTHAVRTVIGDLAREFRVSQQAMRIRLRDLGLLA